MSVSNIVVWYSRRFFSMRQGGNMNVLPALSSAVFSVADVVPTEWMSCQRQLCKRMIVASETYGMGITDVVNCLYAGKRLGNSETVACKNLLV